MLECFAARSDVLKQSSLVTQFLCLYFPFYGVSTYLTWPLIDLTDNTHSILIK